MANDPRTIWRAFVAATIALLVWVLHLVNTPAEGVPLIVGFVTAAFGLGEVWYDHR
jgi:hypothetical protein